MVGRKKNAPSEALTPMMVETQIGVEMISIVIEDNCSEADKPVLDIQVDSGKPGPRDKHMYSAAGQDRESTTRETPNDNKSTDNGGVCHVRQITRSNM